MNHLMLPFVAQIIAQNDGGEVVALIAAAVFGLLGLAFALVMIASMWKIFTKAGEPGWMAIIPFLNIVILAKIARQPIWVPIVALFVPVVNIIALFLIYKGLAEAFGKDIVFAIALFFLPIFVLPYMAFSGMQYQGTPAFA